jgi:hypothetical protein
MEQVADRPLLNDILVEAAKLTHEQRRARIVRCVAEGRHNPDNLPFCIVPSGPGLDRNKGTVRYCDRCWSVIDPHGLTWNWSPQPLSQR